MLYSVLLVTLGLVITLFMSFWSIVFSIFSDADNKVHKVANLWAKSLLLICNIKVKVIGRENLLRGKPQIFMANHQSDFDILIALACIPVQFRWIAKKELFCIPIFGAAMRSAGYIGIDRNNRKEAMKNIDKAVLQIWKGKSIMTFPEDIRSRKDDIKPFKQGAFYLAIESGAPIVPVTIIGSDEIMPQKSLRIIPRPIKLIIGEPIEVNNLNIENRHELIEKVRNTIIKNYNYWQNTENLNIKDLESETT
ncbi:MAG: 1-acyl-sn-glycerol-3-phosphate acyltransferase [Deltaproteobacteria bacterium HGW-Deltaproteobacteria-2]|nr:MAG: 1-acyl-sn-glycerol-3-phosphate acyltransferase [Deltaproteobacteria bacterium HGW-Deltaproteobacteria-2]